MKYFKAPLNLVRLFLFKKKEIPGSISHWVAKRIETRSTFSIRRHSYRAYPGAGRLLDTNLKRDTNSPRSDKPRLVDYQNSLYIFNLKSSPLFLIFTGALLCIANSWHAILNEVQVNEHNYFQGLSQPQL